jgi:hypothetical protein
MQQKKRSGDLLRLQVAEIFATVFCHFSKDLDDFRS